MRQFGTHERFRTKVKQDSESSHLTHALSVRLMEYTWKVSARELQGNGKLCHTGQRIHREYTEFLTKVLKASGNFQVLSTQ